MDLDVAQTVDSFPVNRVACAKKIRDFVETGPEKLVRDALPLLKAGLEKPGTQYLLLQLYLQQRLFPSLCDSALFTLEEAIAAARKLAAMDPRFEMGAWALLSDAEASQKEARDGMGSAACLRLLEIVAAVSNTGRSMLALTRLMRHPDYRVRSKAALLLGKIKRQNTFVEPLMADPDARVRANAVESLWGVNTKGVEDVFWCALSDSDNRVVGNALYGLYQLGETGAIAHLANMLRDPRELFRNTAVWVMAQTADTRFLGVLGALIAAPNCPNRSQVLRAMSKLNRRKKEFAQMPALAIGLGPVRGFENAGVAFTVSVADPAGAPLPDLKGTAFALWENSTLVHDYQAQPAAGELAGQYEIVYKPPAPTRDVAELTIEVVAAQGCGSAAAPRDANAPLDASAPPAAAEEVVTASG